MRAAGRSSTKRRWSKRCVKTTSSAPGLDVFEDEPLLAPGLAELDNVIVVPHIASATMETRLKMGEIAAGNVIKVLTGAAPDTCVNPDVLKMSAA